MSEPYRVYPCPSCGGVNGFHASSCPRGGASQPGGPKPSMEHRRLLDAYVNLRRYCIDLEELIEASSEPGNDSLTAEDLKRLDKSVTVMKVGFKVVKKVLRSKGVEGLRTWREPVATEPERQAEVSGIVQAPPG